MDYNTWTVNLYLQNVEDDYCFYRDLATVIDQDNLAAVIRQDLENLIPETLPNLMRDMLMNNLSEVDWNTVAGSFYD